MIARRQSQAMLDGERRYFDVWHIVAAQPGCAREFLRDARVPRPGRDEPRGRLCQVGADDAPAGGNGDRVLSGNARAGKESPQR